MGKNATKVIAVLLLTLIAMAVSGASNLRAENDDLRASARAEEVETSRLKGEVDDFLAKELAVHLSDIKSLEPPPDRVVGALTTGEFSWGTFMRSLSAFAENGNQRTLAGRDIAKWVGKMGLIEARNGGKAFAQLYAALALRHFGRDLKTNALWQSLSTDEQTAWRSLLNPERFYDPKTNKVINLPENYLGVASRVASISFQLGLLTDRQFLDRLLDRAAAQFANGALFSDDNPPTGRYDRYSNEYARYVWDAAKAVGRDDICEKLKPSLNTQMKLWWDVVAEDGYGYNWGRSQGIVSYLDTPEIASFLAVNPEFRPAPLAQIAALYYQAWLYLRHDYRDSAHLLSLYQFGRGNYSYISIEREWQQTTGFFGKLANSHMQIMNALEREGVKSFPSKPDLPAVSRFEFFRKDGERKAGVWLVRNKNLQFSLPITTGMKPGVADYLPFPQGLFGTAAPVEQVYAAMTPFIQLEDGRTIFEGDGADEIRPSSDGKSLTAEWRRWPVTGTKSGELIDPNLKAEVSWRYEGNEIWRDEVLTASAPVRIKRWRFAVPSTFSREESSEKGTRKIFTLLDDSGHLDVEMFKSGFDLRETILAAGNSAIGRGVKGAVPLHVIYEARDVSLAAGQTVKFSFRIAVSQK